MFALYSSLHKAYFFSRYIHSYIGRHVDQVYVLNIESYFFCELFCQSFIQKSYFVSIDILIVFLSKKKFKEKYLTVL